MKRIYQQYFWVEFMHITEQPQLFFYVIKAFDTGRKWVEFFFCFTSASYFDKYLNIILNRWLLAPFFLFPLLLLAKTFPTSLTSINIFADCFLPPSLWFTQQSPIRGTNVSLGCSSLNTFLLARYIYMLKSFFFLLLILFETGKIPKRSCVFPHTAAFQVPWHVFCKALLLELRQSICRGS